MNEIDTLAGLREDTPPMSARVRAQGRLRLLGEIEGRPRGGRWRLPARRMLLVGAAAVVLTVALAGYQIVDPRGAGSPAEAATVLNRAAAAAVGVSHSAPRSDQFSYVKVVQVAGGKQYWVERWTSVDGTRAGLIRSIGPIVPGTREIPPYDPVGGLRGAPYTVLAALPTDPAALLAVLRADPYVETEVRSKGVGRDVGVWSLIRELVEPAPPAQKAALFRVASGIKGITYAASATDAAGRTGEAVGLGNVQFVFDRDTHVFLGERVLRPGTTEVEFNDAVRQTGVVDVAGVVPGK